MVEEEKNVIVDALKLELLKRYAGKLGYLLENLSDEQLKGLGIAFLTMLVFGGETLQFAKDLRKSLGLE
jgi:hypothetical protein